jgi:hypothetical protein
MGKEEIFDFLLNKRRDIHCELIEDLNMEITWGMGYYSKEYEIQYGGTYLNESIRMNSIYLIENK